MAYPRMFKPPAPPSVQPNIHRTIDNLSILYLEGGIVSPTRVPMNPNPIAKSMEAFGAIYPQGDLIVQGVSSLV